MISALLHLWFRVDSSLKRVWKKKNFKKQIGENVICIRIHWPPFRVKPSLHFQFSEQRNDDARHVEGGTEIRRESADTSAVLPALLQALLCGVLSCISLATRCLLVTLIPAAVDINPPNRWTRIGNSARSNCAVLYEAGGCQAVKWPGRKKHLTPRSHWWVHNSSIQWKHGDSAQTRRAQN